MYVYTGLGNLFAYCCLGELGVQAENFTFQFYKQYEELSYVYLRSFTFSSFYEVYENVCHGRNY
jgi:hypothetical protein